MIPVLLRGTGTQVGHFMVIPAGSVAHTLLQLRNRGSQFR
jgi:hypothetical protein